jgi:hypothetical protein
MIRPCCTTIFVSEYPLRYASFPLMYSSVKSSAPSRISITRPHSAACWNCARPDVWSIISSVGDEEGALQTTRPVSFVSSRAGVGVPVDQHERDRQSSVFRRLKIYQHDPTATHTRLTIGCERITYRGAFSGNSVPPHHQRPSHQSSQARLTISYLLQITLQLLLNNDLQSFSIDLYHERCIALETLESEFPDGSEGCLRKVH